jgi:uncharacterized membrane protein YsdA (DUF1294 family)
MCAPYFFFGLIAIVLGTFLYVTIYFNTDWNPYIVWLVACSGTTFFLYGFDKLQAIIKRLRVPEALLHLLALVGGFGGGWAGMFIFWHKVRKTTFWIILILSTLAHAGLAYYWREYL